MPFFCNDEMEGMLNGSSLKMISLSSGKDFQFLLSQTTILHTVTAVYFQWDHMMRLFNLLHTYNFLIVFMPLLSH